MIDGSGLVLATAGSFVGTHFVLSHPLRRPLVAKLGENGFSGLYSAIAAVTLGATGWAIGFFPSPRRGGAWVTGYGRSRP